MPSQVLAYALDIPCRVRFSLMVSVIFAILPFVTHVDSLAVVLTRSDRYLTTEMTRT
jgi:hypothetical protein